MTASATYFTVLLDQAKPPLPDEFLVYPGDKGNDNICFCNMGADRFGRVRQDIEAGEECCQLLPGLGKCLAAEGDLHAIYSSLPDDQHFGGFFVV